MRDEPYGEEALKVWQASLDLLNKGDIQGAREKIKEGVRSDSIALEKIIQKWEAK